MSPEDQSIELWARQLAGGRYVGTAPEIDALRAAIRARSEAITASAAADDLARARLMKRLEDEGLLTDEKRRRLPWIGAVAAALIAVVGLRFMYVPEEAGSGVIYRGISGSITLASDQPERSAQEILQQLRALGLEPRRLERQDRVIIELEVASEQLEVFQAWAAGKGYALEPGVYRVFVVPSEAR